MSRTIRCKNYEKTCGGSWQRRGFKYGGHYVEEVSTGWGIWYYREPTKLERFKTWYRWHGESRHNKARSPSKSYRKNRQRENRSINKQELIKWIKDNNYEIMCEANPRSCWRDWY